MGARDGLYQLTGMIELDDGFFSTDKKEEDKDQPQKRGRGSQKKSKVLVMAESEPVEGKTTPKGRARKVGHIKMMVMQDLKSDTVTSLVEQNVSADARVESDHSTSYTGLPEVVDEHHLQVIAPQDINKMLPWVHLAISNAKRILLDIFHHMKPEYPQGYLDEFCYKFNRRYFGEKLFDRLMVACVIHQNKFRYNIR